MLKRLSIAAAIITAAAAADAANVLTVRDTITDPHIVYPESYEADVHKMMQNWYLQNYVVLDRNADESADTNVSDEEITDRLFKMPTSIEMPYNKVVRSYIDMYTQRKRSLVESMLGMSTYYMPIFESALEAERMPLELKYLPIIESALNPDAVSRAGATGLWQFMLPTARGLGMEISSLVDERRDPIVSSKMAARYLHQLYDIYGDWSLAIAAYNCGPGNVNKALRQAGEGKKDFWEIYPYLPQETRGYVPSFIAANYVMNYYDKHNISPALAKKPIVTDTVHVTRRVHFKQISDVLGVSIDALRTLNPQYREDVVPGDIRPYVLILPTHQALSYVISQDTIAAHECDILFHRKVVEPSTGKVQVSDDGKYDIVEEVKYHKVRKGETFNSIAKRYGVTVNSIKRTNNIKTLRRGSTIKIITTRKVPREVEEVVQPADTVNIDNIVLPTDTLAATTHDAALPEAAADSIAALPTSPADTVAPAETPAVVEQPKAEVKPLEKPKIDNKKKDKKDTKKPQPQPQYHKVKKGENLTKIAKKYGTTVEAIQKLNPKIKGTQINIGQSIRVK